MQQKVFERLREHMERFRQLPELAELARDLGIHYVSLRQHLQALDRKGLVRFESRGRGQTPRLELTAATGVPVVGSIPAGPLHEAFAEPDGYLGIPGGFTTQFALRVSGDSMADLIQDGDVVVFRKSQPLRNGEICAVRVDGSDVTLKYVDRDGARHILLRPHNPDYPTLRVPAADVSIEGVYSGLVRGSLVEALMEEEFSR